MNFIKTILFTLCLLVVTPIALFVGVIGAPFTKGTSLLGLMQIFDLWKVVFLTLFTSRKTFNLRLRNKQHLSKSKTPVYTIELHQIDYAEMFEFLIVSLYFGVPLYILAMSILSAILYTAVYVSPVSTTVDTMPVKDNITYKKTAQEENEDLYCPCTPMYEYDDSYEGMNTIIFDTDNGIAKVSDNHQISMVEISKATTEKPFEFSSGIINDVYYVEHNGISVNLHEHQAFVFSQDLNSLYFFDNGEFKRYATR